MRELTLNEMEVVSGAAVPVIAVGAAAGAATYMGEVAAGKDFSWKGLAVSTVSGAATSTVGLAAGVARVGAKVATTIVNGAATHGFIKETLDQAGDDYCNDGSNY